MTRPKITLRPITTDRATGRDIPPGGIFCRDARDPNASWMMKTVHPCEPAHFVAVLLSTGNTVSLPLLDRYDVPENVEIIVEYKR